jgi:putative transposase
MRLEHIQHHQMPRLQRRQAFSRGSIHYPPKVAVSNLVNSLKGVSSRLLRKERPDIQKRYWKGALWSPSYFASSCGGAPISIVRQYIEQQQTPH